MRLLFVGLLSVCTALTVTLLGGCGGDNKAELSTLHTAIYRGAGSVWTWTLNESGTFTAEQKAQTDSAQASLLVSGTYVGLASGFYKFTVSTASSPDGSVIEADLPDAGVEAYGYAIPGVIMIVKPIEENSETLVMPVLSGECPGGDVSFNWVQAGTMGEAGDLTAKNLWGNATLDSDSIDGVEWNLAGTESGPKEFTPHSGCSGGVYTFGDGQIQMTSSGVGLVNTDSSEEDIVAFPRDTSITTTSLDGKTLFGLVFMEEDGGRGADIQPVQITMSSNGTGTYAFIEDPEAGTLSATETGSFTITEAGTGAKAGFLKATAGTADSSTPTMWATVANDIGGSGRTFMFASGVSVPEAGEANDSFSMLLVEK